MNDWVSGYIFVMCVCVHLNYLSLIEYASNNGGDIQQICVCAIHNATQIMVTHYLWIFKMFSCRPLFAAYLHSWYFSMTMTTVVAVLAVVAMMTKGWLARMSACFRGRNNCKSKWQRKYRLQILIWIQPYKARFAIIISFMPLKNSPRCAAHALAHNALHTTRRLYNIKIRCEIINNIK